MSKRLAVFLVSSKGEVLLESDIGLGTILGVPSGEPYRLELLDRDTGRGPEQVKFERRGQDLVVHFADEAQSLIVTSFYGREGGLEILGQTPSGQAAVYNPPEATSTTYVANLVDGDSVTQTLDSPHAEVVVVSMLGLQALLVASDVSSSSDADLASSPVAASSVSETVNEASTQTSSPALDAAQGFAADAGADLGTIDSTAASAFVDGGAVVDLLGDAAANALRLMLQDVMAMGVAQPGAATNTAQLLIKGDTNDTVTLLGQWSDQATLSVAGRTYHVFAEHTGAAQVWIDETVVNADHVAVI